MLGRRYIGQGAVLLGWAFIFDGSCRYRGIWTSRMRRILFVPSHQVPKKRARISQHHASTLNNNHVSATPKVKASGCPASGATILGESKAFLSIQWCVSQLLTSSEYCVDPPHLFLGSLTLCHMLSSALLATLSKTFVVWGPCPQPPVREDQIPTRVVS